MIPRSWARWGQEPGSERGIEFWWPPAIPVEANTTELEENRWVFFESEREITLLLALKGQLSYIAYIVPSPVEPLQSWVQQEDLSRVKQCPVVLAFYLPELPSGSVAELQKLSPTLSSSREVFPPPQLGEIALVADAEAGGWCTYSKQTLNQAGLDTLEQLSNQLKQTAKVYEETASKRAELSPLVASTQPWLPLEEHYRIYQEHYQQLQVLAQRLVASYWSVHQRALRSAPLRVIPEAPHILDAAGALIPAPQPVQAVLAAYSNAQAGAEGWMTIKNVPSFIYNKEGGTTSIEFRPSDPDVELEDTTIQSLWHQVRQLSDIDGDVLLAMLAQAIATQHDEKDGIWITGKLILDYRGITPIMKRENGRVRRAGHRQEDLADVAACVSRMSNTWIRVEQWIEEDINSPAPRRKRARKKQDMYLYTRESRLINITDVIRRHELQQEVQKTSPTETNIAVAWRYQIGSWVDPFLEGANRRVAWLLQQALSYDPYHEMWEKRLARYFTFHMRINTSKGGTTVTREIGALIEELSLPINQRDPERTRQRFEKALNRLQSDSLISEWGYQKDNSPLPARRWLQPWLTHRIWVSVAPVDLDGYLPDESG